MALDKPSLAAAIKVILLAANAETNPANFDSAMTDYSNDMADAIDTFVKTGNATGADSGGDSHNLGIS